MKWVVVGKDLCCDLLCIPQRECISVHVGQAGVQMGNACWELYCLEHGRGGRQRTEGHLELLRFQIGQI